MASRFSRGRVRQLRLWAQELDPSVAANGAAEVVRRVCGLQAQDVAAAALAVRARSRGLTVDTVDDARLRDRSIVRTWAMRGTLHWLASEDVGWILAVLGPTMVRASRRRRLELGLDEETCVQGMKKLREGLAERGPMTRSEIVDYLAGVGLALQGQARPHLISRAALEGMLCQGPERGREPTYVLLSDWGVPEAGMSPDRARQELARRYLTAYGPATPNDFAAWSGLPAGDARLAWQGLSQDIVEVESDVGPLWMLDDRRQSLETPAPKELHARLLSSFDTYLLGYRDRGLLLGPEKVRAVNAGGGIVRPTLLVDGRVAGVWSLTKRPHGLQVAIETFEAIDESTTSAVAEEVDDIGRFLGTQVQSFSMKDHALKPA